MYTNAIEVLLYTPEALTCYREELEGFISDSLDSLEKSADTKIEVSIVNELSKDTKIVISLVGSHLGECDKTYYEKYQNREFRFLFYYFQDAEIGVDDFSDEVFERVKFKSEVERDTKLYSSFEGIDEIKRSLETNLKEAISDLIRKTNYSKINTRVINRSKGEKFYNNDNNMRKVDNFRRREKRISLINGLGGVGKTTLAIEYATDALREGIYDYAIWFDVENGIESEIKKFAIGYLLDDSEDGKKESAYYERKFVDFLNDNPNSLVILDNLEYKDPYKKELEDFLNKHERIDIIITSRQNISNLDIHPIELDVFKNEHDGLEMFKLNSTRAYSYSEEQILKEIIKHLGNLPLALEITANFLSEFENMEVDKYLEKLKKEGLGLFKKMADYNHLKSLQATLSINSRIKEKENTLKILKIFSLISPEAIEKEIIDKYLIEALNIDDIERDMALKDLEKFSYIKVSDDGYSMHRLLQKAIIGEFFDGKNEEEQIELITAVSLGIFWWFYNSFNDNEYGSFFAKTVQHIEYILNIWKNLDIDKSKIYLYTSLAAYNDNIGVNLQDTLSIVEEILVLLESIDMRNKEKSIIFITCGDILRLDKQYDRAKIILNKSLEIVSDKEIEADIHHNIAQIHNDNKEYSESEKHYKTSLEINRKVLGDNHFKLSYTLNNLALIYRSQKKYEKSEKLLKESLIIDNRPTIHPTRANTYRNLGLLYIDTKEYVKSFNYYYLAFITRLDSELTSANKFWINQYFSNIIDARNRLAKNQKQSINKKIEELNKLLKLKGFKKLKLKKL